ncbi:MAG TPA: L-seryl-tRNA(Sec) selenium transferase, partial [Thermomicrobiales bacterium]|nr:L-seryl-tRNA(Sec) selenium transferase [Thermomicrobiales bacterium]
MTERRDQLLRGLPAVHALLADDRVRVAADGATPDVVRDVVRKHLDAARAGIVAGNIVEMPPLVDTIAMELQSLLWTRPSAVINGTGVIIQTNLGRAPVSDDTARAMAGAASSYVALETDLATG